METYLPPTASKVMEFTTVETYVEYLENLSMSCNMPFVNITLNVGAVMNPYKFVGGNPETFKNVVTHLGDFHFFKESIPVSSHLVFGDSVSLCPRLAVAKLWLWSWSLHVSSNLISTASRSGSLVRENICRLLTASESVKDSLVFPFDFSKSELREN